MKKILFVFALSMILFLSGCGKEKTIYEYQFSCQDEYIEEYEIAGQGTIEANEEEAYHTAFEQLKIVREGIGRYCIMNYIRPTNGSFGGF